MFADLQAPADDREALRSFLKSAHFFERGALVTDLDGTAVMEHEGRVWLPPEVEDGLRRVHELGRPVIANTLRFPLSVIRVFATEWHRVTHAGLPLVSLKGAQHGQVVRSRSGEIAFEEWGASTLSDADVAELMEGIEGIIGDGAPLIVFRYPRDWTRGECIWVP